MAARQGRVGEEYIEGNDSDDFFLRSFYGKAEALLEESGGKLDSLQFGRKWKAAYPEDDLDTFR